MARIADPETLQIVRKILDGETGEQSQYRLVSDMLRGTPAIEEKEDKLIF